MKENSIVYTQRDNKHSPDSECMLTSSASGCATLLKSIDVDVQALDDQLIEVFRRYESKWEARKKYWERRYSDDYGDMRPDQVFPVAAEIINELPHKIKATYRWLSQDKIKKFLDDGCVVVTSTRLCGLAHVICIVDYDDTNGCWYVLDTWGNALTNYRDKEAFAGAYPYETKGFKSESNCITLELTQ